MYYDSVKKTIRSAERVPDGLPTVYESGRIKVYYGDRGLCVYRKADGKTLLVSEIEGDAPFAENIRVYDDRKIVFELRLHGALVDTVIFDVETGNSVGTGGDFAIEALAGGKLYLRPYDFQQAGSSEDYERYLAYEPLYFIDFERGAEAAPEPVADVNDAVRELGRTVYVLNEKERKDADIISRAGTIEFLSVDLDLEEGGTDVDYIYETLMSDVRAGLGDGGELVVFARSLKGENCAFVFER